MAIELRGMVPMLSVFHMPTTLHFYRDLLGFAVVSTSDPASGDDVGWCLLRRGEIELMLNTAYDPEDQPDQPDVARFEAHNDTVLYFACPDVDAMHVYLRDRLPKVNLPEIAHYGMKQLYVRDPDGYNVCFQWPVR